MDAQPFDVVVVGGGAAGLSAALVLGRARRRVAVVDAGAPRNKPAAHMQGFLSRDGMPPAELLAVGRNEVTGYGAELIDDQVATIESGFIVRLTGGQVLETRRILVATGVRDELPEIPGVRDRWGRDVLHCPYCHGWEVRDHGVELVHGQVIERTAVFVRPGIRPHADGLLIALGCEIDEAGFAIVDTTGRTTAFGVWAAGNVAEPRAQVITAAGAGSAAAIAINADLVNDDVERALAAEPGV